MLAVLVVLRVTNICTLHFRTVTIFKTNGHMGLLREYFHFHQEITSGPSGSVNFLPDITVIEVSGL